MPRQRLVITFQDRQHVYKMLYFRCRLRGWTEPKPKLCARTEIPAFGLGLQEIPAYRLQLSGRKQEDFISSAFISESGSGTSTIHECFQVVSMTRQPGLYCKFQYLDYTFWRQLQGYPSQKCSNILTWGNTREIFSVSNGLHMQYALSPKL